MALSAPQNINATHTAGNSFIIRWDAVVGATSYRIYNLFSAAYEVATNSVNISNVPTATTFNIEISAYDGTEESVKTAATVKTSAEAPRSVQILDMTSDTVSVIADIAPDFTIKKETVSIPKTATKFIDFDEEVAITEVWHAEDPATGNFPSLYKVTAYTPNSSEVIGGAGTATMTKTVFAKRFGIELRINSSFTPSFANVKFTKIVYIKRDGSAHLMDIPTASYHLSEASNSYMPNNLKFETGLQRNVAKVAITGTNVKQLISRGCNVKVTASNNAVTFVEVNQHTSITDNNNITIFIDTTDAYNEWKLNIEDISKFPYPLTFDARWQSLAGTDVIERLNFYSTSGDLVCSSTVSNNVCIVPRTDAILNKYLSVKAEANGIESTTALDGVKLSDSTKPFDLTASNVTASSFDLSWSNPADLNKFKIYGSPVGTLTITDFAGDEKSTTTVADYRTMDNPKFPQYYQKWMWLYAQDKNEFRKVVTLTGELVASVPCPIPMASQFAVSLQGYMFVLDKSNRRVIKIDMNGNILKETPKQANSTESMFDGIGLFGYSGDHIIIPDPLTDKVHVLSHELVPISYFYCGVIKYVEWTNYAGPHYNYYFRKNLEIIPVGQTYFPAQPRAVVFLKSGGIVVHIDKTLPIGSTTTVVMYNGEVISQSSSIV